MNPQPKQTVRVAGADLHWTRAYNVRTKLLEAMRHYHKSVNEGVLTVWKFMDSNTEFIDVIW